MPFVKKKIRVRRFYHGTTVGRLKDILSQGILPSTGRYGTGVALARSVGDAIEWAKFTAWQRSEPEEDIVVLQIDVPSSIKLVSGIDEVLAKVEIHPDWITKVYTFKNVNKAD